MIVLSYIQIVTGSGLSFISKVKTDRSYVPALWLCHIRTFLYSCKGNVFISDAWCPKPQHLYTGKLNDVCLYLGVLMVADITNDEGMYIMPWALSSSSRAKVLLPWPNQGKVSNRGWVLWRRFLKQ
eukprot:2755700-Ditylum_brightwellii.AAC.1